MLLKRSLKLFSEVKKKIFMVELLLKDNILKENKLTYENNLQKFKEKIRDLEEENKVIIFLKTLELEEYFILFEAENEIFPYDTI